MADKRPGGLAIYFILPGYDARAERAVQLPTLRNISSGLFLEIVSPNGSRVGKESPLTITICVSNVDGTKLFCSTHFRRFDDIWGRLRV